MRCLLGFLLTHILFQSFLSLWPYKEWADDLELDRLPWRLPTRAEREQLRAKQSPDNPNPITDRVMGSIDSIWDYHKPWPSAETRKQLAKRAKLRRENAEVGKQGPGGSDAEDWGRFTLAWIGTRLYFQGTMLGFDQRWTMFSPNVGKFKWVIRFRLLYEDGSELVVRSLADPEDRLRYETMRFFTEKTLQYSLYLESDNERRLGYCNLLSHRHATNEAGSRLMKIRLVKIGYDYPAPGENVHEVLAAQKGPPGWENIKPFFEYDVLTREGKELDAR